MGSEPAERLGGLLRADLFARKALEDLAAGRRLVLALGERLRLDDGFEVLLCHE